MTGSLSSRHRPIEVALVLAFAQALGVDLADLVEGLERC
jgi:hypothetical protein